MISKNYFVRLVVELSEPDKGRVERKAGEEKFGHHSTLGKNS